MTLVEFPLWERRVREPRLVTTLASELSILVNDFYRLADIDL